MFSEIFFLIVLLVVLLDAEQLIELIKIVLSLYKDLKLFFSKLRNSINVDFKNIISDSSDAVRNLGSNYLNDSAIFSSPQISERFLYQPELNFDSQPELFDDLCL